AIRAGLHTPFDHDDRKMVIEANGGRALHRPRIACRELFLAIGHPVTALFATDFGLPRQQRAAKCRSFLDKQYPPPLPPPPPCTSPAKAAPNPPGPPPTIQRSAS